MSCSLFRICGYVISISFVAVAFFLATTPVPAGEKAGAEVGVLTCVTVPDSRINLLVHSTADIDCEFKDSDGAVERYRGETGIGLGIDLHIAHEEKVVFTVVAHHFAPGTHQLAGRYGGAKAGVTAGHGGAAALLIGGDHDSIGLKPAVSHSQGVGVAAGLSYVYLEPME
ncbi:MAG: DUF992 domain-containing protein [Pseudomonadota bacterium]